MAGASFFFDQSAPFHFDHGWVAGVRQLASPNYNNRPVTVDLLVIHNISLPAGVFGAGYIEQLFLNTLDCNAHPSFGDLRELKVSAHFLITRDGDITQFVSTDKRAWHAGKSQFGARDNCNDFSIGIELEGSDDTSFTEEQYLALAWLARGLMRHYPGITAERIVGHSDVAPGRKTDPGPCFDWARLRTALA